MKKDLENFTSFAKKSKFSERILGKNCIVYTRVSTKEQAEGFSLETQKREIEQKCLQMGFNILEYFGGVYESAKSDERKEFSAMLKFARKSKEKVSHIMVYSVDRFSRSGANAIYIASELRKENIQIHAVTQPADTTTATGKMQQNMQFIFSEYDNDLRREKCTAGMKEMLMKGYWCGKAPLGYTQITRRKRQNQDLNDRQIITINETGKLLCKAFHWKAYDRMSNVKIADKLKAFGLDIREQRLSELFANPFYCGLLSHNLLNGELIEGKHEKLISRKVFLLANELRGPQMKHSTEFEDVPLKHYMRCDVCENPMVGYVVKKKGLWYYKCNTVGCKCNRSAKELNRLFKQKLNEYTVNNSYMEPAKLQFLKILNQKAEEKTNDLPKFKAQLTEVERKLETIQERFATGEIEKEIYLKFKKKYLDEKNMISSEMGNLDFQISNLEKRLDKYFRLLSKLPQTWDSSTYLGKLELQEFIFPKGIIYDRVAHEYRTPEINEVAFVLSTISTDMEGYKKPDSSIFLEKSGLVPPSRPNMNELLEDTRELARIWDLYGHLLKEA